MIPREPGCYILNHISSNTFYIGSTGNLKNRENNLMSSLNSRTNHNPRLQELYSDDPNVIFEYLVTRDREEAYDVEQAELDKWLGHPNCLNINNEARRVWIPGTVPQERIDSLRLRNTRVHSGKKYRLGHSNTEEQRRRQSESIKLAWETRPRVATVARPVSVNGVTYPSAGHAAEALGFSRRTVVVRAGGDDERYRDWFYL